MLRWTRRITIGAPVLLVLMVGVGVGYEQWSRWSAVRSHPPTGRMVEASGARSHLNCVGKGEPTVIFESGWSGGGSLDWILVQPEIARFTRACSYDRAGVLWSERRSGPRDAKTIASELDELLEAAGETPPYVMVGHSLGGPLVRVFDAVSPGEVAGFVFVDVSHPDQGDRMPAEAEGPSPDPLWAKVRAATGLYRLRATVPSYGLPNEAAEAVRDLMPSGVASLLDEHDAVGEIFRQAREAGSLDDRPLVVLTATRHARPGMSQAAIAEGQRAWQALQAELAELSTNSIHRTVEGAHHYIQLGRPEAVVEATREVVMAVRDGTSLTEERATGAGR